MGKAKLSLFPCELWVENMTECGFGTAQCSLLATGLCQGKLVLPMDPAVCSGAQSPSCPCPSLPALRFFFYSYLLLSFNLCCRLSLKPTTCLLSTFPLVIYIYFTSSPGGKWIWGSGGDHDWTAILQMSAWL